MAEKSEARQDAQLGSGKAQLWREGKLSLRDLLDQSGNPMTLAELQVSLKGSKFPKMVKMHRSAWADNFPNTIIDRALGDAKSHSLDQKAKSGNIESAFDLASDLVTEKATDELKNIINGRNVILVPVHAEEHAGLNKIPLAVSFYLSDKLGVGLSTEIIQAIKVSRTGKDGWHRLANPPAFKGKLSANSLVVLVDDTQTQGGGTFAALKGHIEAQGSKVIAAYALRGKQYSVQLRLSRQTLTEIRNEYGSIESWWKDSFGYGFECLTEWEARYIIRSGKSPDKVRDKISEIRPKESG